MEKQIISVLAICVALAVTACGDSDDASREATGSERASGGAAEPDAQPGRLPRATPAQAARRPKAKVPQGRSSSGLAVRDLVLGTGEVAETGKVLFMRYVAGIYETGEELESTPRPVGFLFGGGDWSYGFEEGMAGMRVGGRRELVFPTTSATLPPGSQLGDTLVYVVDLLDVSETGS